MPQYPPSKIPINRKLLFPIRFSFNSQHFHIIIKLSSINRFKHYPFPIMIDFCFIISPANGIRKGTSYIFKFCSFIFPKIIMKPTQLLLRISNRVFYLLYDIYTHKSNSYRQYSIIVPFRIFHQ